MFGESPCYEMVPIDLSAACHGPGIQHMGFIHLSGFEAQTPGDSASATHVNEFKLWTPERLTVDPADIKIVHLSGDMKPWDRDYVNPQDDAEFALN